MAGETKARRRWCFLWLTASARLEGLVAGSYTVTPARLRVGAPVEALWTAAPETVVVLNGGVAAAAVEWTKRPGTGALWATAMASATVMAFGSPPRRRPG